jgi:hypothetical protein
MLFKNCVFCAYLMRSWIRRPLERGRTGTKNAERESEE